MTPGFDAHSREREKRSASAFVIKSVKFPLIPQKSSEKQLPHTYELTHLRQKMLVCFSPSQPWAMVKNLQPLF